MTFSTRAIAIAFIPVLVGYTVAGAVMLDLRARGRIANKIGVNPWGYQGPAKFRKKPGERRIALVGGSAAFGFGVGFEQSPPSIFEYTMTQGWRSKYPGQPTTVVGLAEVGAGAGSYIATLQDYAYLDPDAICIYDGYAAVGGNVTSGGRRESFVFRKTGYLPNLFDARRARLPEHLSIAPELQDGAGGDASCGGVSAAYCAAMADTVAWGLAHGKNVVVVTPPYVSRRHELQQQSLAARLQERFGRDPRFVYVNRGSAIDLRDRTFSFDGIHLTRDGVNLMADSLADVFFDVVRAR